MSRPVIGIIGASFLIHEDYHIFGAGKLNTAAVAEACGAVPIILPTDPDLSDISELMALCDGFVFTGARANVHPEEYGEAATPAHGDFDRDRDRVALPLIRACIEAGQPIIGICRGFQEVAVAMGSTLHPEIRDLPGRDNHRMPPDGTLEEKFALRHAVTFSPDGPFAKLLSEAEVMTNTLHGQGIKQAGPRVVIDGTAPDGTPEAIYIKDAPGFTLSVQWHPEWNATVDPMSKPLFAAFGQAAAAWKQSRS
ncbi:MAG: gamma-glutamyl-gamma-aminobutyrate hydrolase family protein [Yoonia sp.]|nr:gamma-glutamyl-gamma-aminobutyrate hydrolase family protein [Yoonia sp.]